MLVSKNSQMEVNTGIQQQAQRVEVFTIDEVRRTVVKTLCQYVTIILFILVLLCLNLWCIFWVIMSTKFLDRNQKIC